MMDGERVRQWRSNPTIAAGIVVALLGTAYYAWLGRVIFPVDDAYITQRNAEFLFRGADPAWADATPLHGATSLVHVALIGILALVLPVAIAQCAVGIVSAALYVAGAVELAKTDGLDRPRAIAVATLAFATPWVIHQLANGLETGLALAIIIWMLVALRWSERRVHRLFPALAGLAPFARPELGPLVLLLFASIAIDRYRHRREQLKADLKQLALWSLATSLPLVMVMLLVTDSPIPLTIEAKRLWFAESCWGFSVKLAHWAKELGTALPMFGPAILGVCFVPFRRHGWALVAFVVLFLLGYLWQFPSAVGHYHHRYLFVLLPIMLVGISGALAQWRRLGLAVGSIALAYAIVTLPTSVRSHQASLRAAQSAVTTVAAWLQAHAAPGSTILVHDAGYIATVPGLHFVDLVGLKTPSSVNVHREVTFPTCGRARYIADDRIARGAHPAYFVVIEGWDRGFGLIGGLRARGWTARRADPERAPSVYAVYALEPPPDDAP